MFIPYSPRLAKFQKIFFLTLPLLLFLLLGKTVAVACDTGVAYVPCQSTGDRTLVVAQDGTGYFSTIQAALDISQPGDTLQVKTGAYAESLQITRSGTPTHPVTLVNYPGHSPVIAPVGTDLPTVAHSMDMNAEWVILEGFTIINSWDGIRVSKGHNTIRHNTIYNNYSHGILVRSAGNLLIEDKIKPAKICNTAEKTYPAEIIPDGNSALVGDRKEGVLFRRAWLTFV